MYEYTIDANERYEDWMCTSIFSTELLSKEEFEEVVKKAIEKTVRKDNDGYKEYGDWSEVANMIVKMDDRFFYPKKGHIAIIQYSDDNAFKGVY